MFCSIVLSPSCSSLHLSMPVPLRLKYFAIHGLNGLSLWVPGRLRCFSRLGLFLFFTITPHLTNPSRSLSCSVCDRAQISGSCERGSCAPCDSENYSRSSALRSSPERARPPYTIHSSACLHVHNSSTATAEAHARHEPRLAFPPYSSYLSASDSTALNSVQSRR